MEEKEKNMPHVWAKEKAGKGLWNEIQSWKDDGKTKPAFLSLSRRIQHKDGTISYERTRVFPEDVSVLRTMLDKLDEITTEHFPRSKEYELPDDIGV